MIIEYYTNNIDEKDINIEISIKKILGMGINNILSPIHQCKYIKKNFSSNQLNIGCLIDYPLACVDIERRIDLIKDAIDNHINYVVVTVPFYYIINRKYSKFREDIKKNTDLCLSNNVGIRYMLEYRKFDYQLLTKVCNILIENGINTIYPSTGMFIDNIEDNITACVYLRDKTGIQTIVNGNIWHKSQINSITKIHPHGISFNQISSMQLFYGK